jgi:O-antigen ligase
LLVPVLLATGSRSGLVLALVAAVSTYFVAPVKLRLWAGRRVNLFLLVPAIIAPVLAILMVLFGRALAVDRLTRLSLYSSEVRITNVSTVWDLVWRFFPFGSGFGSFDPIFRGFEQDSQLDETYFNHAHNELLELAMTGGAPALLVLVAFLLWAGWRTYAASRAGARDSDSVFVRLGAVMIALMLAGSLVDYPLRTPIFAFLFALACSWLVGGGLLPRSPAGKAS